MKFSIKEIEDIISNSVWAYDYEEDNNSWGDVSSKSMKLINPGELLYMLRKIEKNEKRK